MNTFAKIAQLNADLHNDHPVAHTALTVGYGVAAVVVVRKTVRRYFAVRDAENA